MNNELASLLANDLRPVRPMPSSSVLSFAVVAFVTGVATLFWALVGFDGWMLLSSLQKLATLAYTAGALGLIAFVFARSLQPASTVHIRPAWAIGLVLAGFVAINAGMLPMDADPSFVAHGWFCLGSGMVVFAVTSAAAFLLVRMGWALDAQLTGALAGGIGGIAAVLSLQYSCVHQYALHVLVWHGVILLVSLAAGYGLGGFLSNRMQSA